MPISFIGIRGCSAKVFGRKHGGRPEPPKPLVQRPLTFYVGEDWKDKQVVRVKPVRGHTASSFDKHLIMSESKGTTVLAVDEGKMVVRDLVDLDSIRVNRAGVPADFLRQLTAENLVVHEKPNGALDCFVYALCANRLFEQTNRSPIVRELLAHAAQALVVQDVDWRSVDVLAVGIFGH